MFIPEAPFPVYCKDCWRSDNWEGMVYGRDYDFSKPFFTQWQELFMATPRQGIIQQGENIDSEYVNRANSNRGCYLIFGSSRNEFCRYGTMFNDSKDSMDGYNVQKSERCYECTNCFQCYNLLFSQECNSCSNSMFLFDCRNCESCFGCVNLRSKSYYIFNKQVSKDEYQKFIKDFDAGSYQNLKTIIEKFNEFKKKYIVPWAVIHHSVGSTGNWLDDCKNIRQSFDCRNVEDVAYSRSLFEAKDAMDYSNWGQGSERIYECINIGIQSFDIAFSTECWVQAGNLKYCMNCEKSQNLFASIGLKNKQYCILNKQYSKEEYEAMVPRIIEHMNEVPYVDKFGRTYRYGEFFPINLSPYSYNETIAQEYLPLTREEAEKQGYHWKGPEPRDYEIHLKSEDLPDHIKDLKDSIIGKNIQCFHNQQCNEQCTQAFKIVPEELQFYRKMNLPLPRLCHNCRYYQRLKQRGPLKLWPRRCQCAGQKSENEIYTNTAKHFHENGHCPNEFETSYAPERKEIVYCEQCYNSEVV